MKAMAITQFGDIHVFKEITLEKPTLIPGHVLIKVLATSVNPLDYKLRQGIFPDFIKSFPAILHGDVAGIVEHVGDGVTQFSPGDEVYGCVGGFLDMGGGLAEYVLADAQLIAQKPKTLSFSEAAALPLVALTAWEGLVLRANVQPGQSVMICGATGGVGHIAIQIAKYKGAKVFALSSSSEKMEMAKTLGADVAINYKHTPVADCSAIYADNKGFDIVFDTVGGENLSHCFEAAAIFGKVISILSVGNYNLTPALFKGLSLHMIMQPLPLITGISRSLYGEILTKISALVDAGFIKPLIDANKFTIAEAGSAHAHLESGNAIGKVVLSQ